jgi:hypothetical protein
MISICTPVMGKPAKGEPRMVLVLAVRKKNAKLAKISNIFSTLSITSH